VAITRFPSASVTGNGRTLIRGVNASSARNDLTVALYGSLGGGTASLQVSHHDAPSLSTDSEWATIDGASSLTISTAYRIEVSGAAIAINLTGATAPTLTVAWS
jgi:hypothetical protein